MVRMLRFHAKMHTFYGTDAQIPCKYAYKHAIHHAFQALAGQAKREQTL